MKNFTTSFGRATLLSFFLLAAGAAHQAFAQSPSSGGPTPQAPTSTDVPLDGGASLLLASGVAFGLRHLRQRRKK